MGGERLRWGERKKERKRKGKGKGKGKERKEAREEEWTLPVASRSLHQVPMEGQAAPALGPREGQVGLASTVS